MRRLLALLALAAVGGAGLAAAAEIPRPLYGVVNYECGPLAGGAVTVLDTAKGQSVSATTASDGSWSVDLPDAFTPGDPLTVTATAGSVSGSVSTTAGAGIQRAPDILLQAPPLLAISSPTAGSRTTLAAVEVVGSADGTGSAPRLYINGAEVPVAADLSFRTTVPLSLGANTINATLLDCMGNSVQQSLAVQRDAPPAGAFVPAPSPAAASPAPSAPRAVVLNIRVEPDPLLLGRTATVSVAVRNDGGAGEVSVTLLADGTPAETLRAELAAGGSRTLHFFLAPKRSGPLNLTVGSLRANLTVAEALPPAELPVRPTAAPSPSPSPSPTPAATEAPASPAPTPRPTPGLEAGLAAAALAAALALRRRR
ncbi:MAG: hypothetical protein QXT68_02035 [Halobacteria archaeon]